MPVVRGKDIEVLFSASAIARRNLELAKEIAGKDYTDLLVISHQVIVHVETII